MKLRIGHLSTFYHTAILLMAGRRGCRAFDAEWRLFGTGPAIVEAFKKGELDIAYVGLPPVVAGIDRGTAIKCIAGGHIEGTVISGRAGHRDYNETDDLADIMSQFKGLSIGVPGPGSIHDVILQNVIRTAGLSNDIRVVHFRWADLALEAMVKGEVEAVVGTPALAAAARMYSDGKILYPPSLLWPSNPSYGIAARSEFLTQNRNLLKDFLHAHEDAAAFLRAAPEEAADIISKYVGFVDTGLVLETLRISPKYCAAVTKKYIDCTLRLAEIQKELGYIRELVNPEAIFDTTLSDEIHGPGDHYGE